MIEFKDLKFVFDGKILFRHFSEIIHTGEKIVIAGPSGCGKSTLLSCIAGFVVPDQGQVIVDGMPVDEYNLPAIRNSLAWVPQEFALPYQSVREMINAIFHLKANRAKMPDKQKVLDVFRQLGLSEELYDKRLVEISGGQRQRVMLTIAVLLDKKIILLDEPTSALDAAAVDEVIVFFKKMKDKTIVAVSHDPRFIDAFDRVIRCESLNAQITV